MTHLFPSVFSASQVWSPPSGFFFGLLVVGAFLFSGVALLIFSFYEDFYWRDKEFRKQLRYAPSRREVEEGDMGMF